MSMKNRRPIIGVIGGREEASDLAYSLGKMIAHNDYFLLTGGGPGVMESASRGAAEARGMVIGILPNEKANPVQGYPNEYVDVPIFTGMSDARNAIIVKTCDVVVALSGGAGTLSEIALAIKSGTPVVGLGCPSFNVKTDEFFVRVSTLDAAMTEVEKLLKKRDL
jgi:uncharacterized protein (TIGR00725 family)